jgi:lysophospholipase L1-like esterase
MKKDILIFGDSIAYGIGDPLLGGWVDLLKRYTWEKKPDLNVYNFCIDGNTTRDLLKRLSIQSSQTLYDKEAIFIAIGVNDSITYKGETFLMEGDEFERNLIKLAEEAKAFTQNVYLVGLAQVDESLTSPFPGSRSGKTWQNERIEAFEKIISGVAEKQQVIFIPMFDLLKNSDMYDGLHVNTIGQKKMFDRIVEKVHFI